MRAHLRRVTIIACMAPVSLSGCHRHSYSGPSELSTKGYRYRTGVAVVGPERDTLRVAVVVVNESNEQRLLPFSHCPVYANPVQARVTGSGRNWSSEVFEQRQHVVFRDSNGKPMMEACVASLVAMTFPPGASYTSVLKVPVREILGDSLSYGTYRVIARLVTNGGDGRSMDAGEVFLSLTEVRTIKGSQVPDPVHGRFTERRSPANVNRSIGR